MCLSNNNKKGSTTQQQKIIHQITKIIHHHNHQSNIVCFIYLMIIQQIIEIKRDFKGCYAMIYIMITHTHTLTNLHPRYKDII